MRATVYNVSIAAGVTLVSVGAGLIYVPAGLITAGLLVLSLTFSTAWLVSRRGS